MIKRAENLSEGGKLRESTLSVACPQHYKDIVENFASNSGKSLSKYIRDAIREKIECTSNVRWEELFQMKIQEINEKRKKQWK